MKSDADFVGKVLQGDQNAYRLLVDKYKQAVYSIVLSKVHNATEAQDLTQEALIRAYLNLESLKDRTKFGQWLSAIARNVAWKWLERNRPHESLEYLVEPDDANQKPLQLCAQGYAADEILQKEQMRQLLWKGIYSLPEAFREVLLLSYMRGMKRKEVADFLGISESAVKNRLYKARKLLKEVLNMLEETVKNQKLPENFTDEVISEAMKRGRQYLEKKRWEQAKGEFRRAVDIQEDYAPAYKGIGLAARGEVLERLDNSSEPIASSLLEEAYQELSRAYRLGARDWDMVETLSELYGQFGRREEQCRILWEVSQTSENPAKAFKAGAWATSIESRYLKQPEKAVEHHRQLLSRFENTVPIKDRLHSHIYQLLAYKEASYLDEWLETAEELVEKGMSEIPLHDRMAYTCQCGMAYFQSKRYQDAIRVGEDFLDFLKELTIPHPYRRWYMLDTCACILQSYQTLGLNDKLQDAFQFIDKTLNEYEEEWMEKIAFLEGLSDSEVRKLDEIYSEVGEGYPMGGSKEEIRKWLDKMYRDGIDCAYHNIGCVFSWIGEGERAIRCFLNKRKGENGNHYMWLASLMLQFRGDREEALSYLKRAAEDRSWAASGGLKMQFESFEGFSSVQNDREFLDVINASVIAD